MDERYNHEHYKDKTAHQAMDNIERENSQRVSAAIHQVRKLFRQHGFIVVERIVLQDSKTGQIYR